MRGIAIFLALDLACGQASAGGWTAELLSALFDGSRPGAGAASPVPAGASAIAPSPPQSGDASPEAAGPRPNEPSLQEEGCPDREKNGGPCREPESRGVRLAGPDEEAGGFQAAKAPPVEEIPESDWRLVGSIEDAVSDRNPSSREKQDFWDQLRNQAFWHGVGDQLCKEVQLPADYKLAFGDHGSAQPQYKRYLRTGVDGRMALVDRARLNLRLSGGVQVLELGEGLPLSVSAGADLIGDSVVVRPLAGAKACGELDELFDLRTLKTVYPLASERFAAMMPGELWAMPLVLRAGLGAGTSIPVAGGVSLNVSYGYSRQGGVNVTLRRLDKDSLRVRVRIDYVRVHGPSIGLDYTIFGSDFREYSAVGRERTGDALGLAGEAAFKAVDREVRRQMERYLGLKLAWLNQWVREDHALIEFLLDPNDAGQMNALQELLAGGRIEVLDSLLKRLKTAGAAFLDAQDLKDGLPELAGAYREALGGLGAAARTFSGADRVEAVTRSLMIKFPLLFHYARNSGKRDDRISLLDDSGGEFGVYRSHLESQQALLDLPFLGKIIAYNQRRSVLAFTHQDKDGRAGPPGLVYVRQEGYTMQNEDAARGLALDVDRLMALAGTRGSGKNPRTALPLSKVFPQTPRKEPDVSGDRSPDHDFGPTYRRGVGAFTLALGEKAVSDILRAKPEEVLRAYAAGGGGWSDPRALNWAIANSRVGPDGRVDYDRRKNPFARDTPAGDGSNSMPDPDLELRRALEHARTLVSALQKARGHRPEGSTDPEGANRQVRTLRDILADPEDFGLSGDDMLKVLVQLVEPEHLSAEFVLSAKPWEGKKPAIEGRYLLNRGLEEDQGLRRLSELANRFASPSEYSD